MMKITLDFTLWLTICLVALPSPACAGGDEDKHSNVGVRRLNGSYSSTTIAVFGDWPYSQALLDNKDVLINSINSDPSVEAVVHVGDIHSGSMSCTGAGLLYDASKGGFVSPDGTKLYQIAGQKIIPDWNINIYNAFQQFKAPVVYTPGDNEWSDCHKVKQLSSGAPLKELAAVRKLFFAEPGLTLGLNRMEVLSQASLGYPENVMWTKKRIVYATFNIPGGSNDDADPWTAPFDDPTAQLAERTDREAANLKWLDATFNYTTPLTRSVVIMIQADMWDPEKGATKLTNYAPFVTALAYKALDFGKSVLILNGDSHVFKDDTPLVNTTGVPCQGLLDANGSPLPCDLSTIHPSAPVPVPNLRRIVVWGSSQAQKWLKLTFNTNTGTATYVNVDY